MAEGNAVSAAIKWIILRYKSVPAIAVRSTLATLLGMLDLASDIYTIDSLFELGHLGAALTMVILSFTVQVRPACADPLPRSP